MKKFYLVILLLYNLASFGQNIPFLDNSQISFHNGEDYRKKVEGILFTKQGDSLLWANLNKKIPAMPFVNAQNDSVFFKTVQGDTIRTSKILGKVTILNCFFKYCGPCLGEIGYFNTLFDKYSDKVNFLAFSTMDTRADLAPNSTFQTRFPWKWSLVPASWEGNKEEAYEKPEKRSPYYQNITKSFLNENFHIKNTVPSTFFIDKKGVIRFVTQGLIKGDEEQYLKIYSRIIEELLKE